MDSGEPTFNFPDRLANYELDLYSYGDGSVQLWCAAITKQGFTVARDHFRTGEEAYEFIEVVVNMLDLKYPNAVCSNFSFLTKQE